MRVLMFGWEFPPYQAGGLATATVGLVKGLLSQGLAVTLVVPFPVGASPLPGLRLLGAASGEALQVRRIPSPMLPYGGEAGYREVFAAARRTEGPRAVYGATLVEEVERFAGIAAEIAAREPHDLIDAHDWLCFSAAIAARQVSSRPFVAHIHATEYDRAGEFGNSEILMRERAGLHAADHVISNSDVLRRRCVERFGVPAERIDVVHWGVDDAAPVPAGPEVAAGPVGAGLSPARTERPRRQRPPTVLFLGRVTWQKGPDWFIEVAARVAESRPDARFVVAGAGDMLPHLIQRSAELGIAHRVHFTGGLNGADVARAYRRADVCVMPSVAEPFGLVALEALRHGTPVIIPRTAGVSEVIRHAFKTEFWDVDDMAAKVLAVLRYPSLQAELRAQGLAEVSAPRFGLDEPARRTAEVYRKVVAAASLGGS